MISVTTSHLGFKEAVAGIRDREKQAYLQKNVRLEEEEIHYQSKMFNRKTLENEIF